MTFGAHVEIYLDGPMHFMGSYDINADGNPTELLIYQGSNARLQFDGGGVLNAGIIAPYSMVQFNGDDTIHGIVIADQMLLNGGDWIHVDEDLARRLNLRPPGPLGLLD